LPVWGEDDLVFSKNSPQWAYHLHDFPVFLMIPRKVFQWIVVYYKHLKTNELKGFSMGTEFAIPLVKLGRHGADQLFRMVIS